MQKLGSMIIVLALASWSVAALAAPAAAVRGDAAAGAKVYTQCKMCHATTAGVHRIGPALAQVVGRKAGTQPNYNYSPALKASGVVWTEPKLSTFLEAPRVAVPGTKMSFIGVRSPQDRADIIAYLKTQ